MVAFPKYYPMYSRYLPIHAIETISLEEGCSHVPHDPPHLSYSDLSYQIVNPIVAHTSRITVSHAHMQSSKKIYN
jgi:hypothetical protein